VVVGEVEDEAEDDTNSISPTDSASNQSLSKSTRRSPVWKFFEDLVKNKSVKCRLCPAVLVMNHGTTSPLLKHLNSQHPTWRSAGRVAGGQTTITTYLSPGPELFHKEKFDKLVLRMFVLAGLPFNVAGVSAVQEAFAYLNPLAIVACPTTIRRHAMTLFLSQREKVGALLGGMDSKVG
jgi:hypothetical protein